MSWVLKGEEDWRPGCSEEGHREWNPLSSKEKGPGGPDSYVLRGEELILDN